MRLDILQSSRSHCSRLSAGSLVCHQNSILSLGSRLPSTEVRPTLQPRVAACLVLVGISESSDNESFTEYVPANPGFSAAPVFSHLLTVPCCSPQNRPGFLALTHQSTYSSPQSSLPFGLEASPVQCWYLLFAGLHAWPVSFIHILEFALSISHIPSDLSRGRMIALCD